MIKHCRRITTGAGNSRSFEASMTLHCDNAGHPRPRKNSPSFFPVLSMSGRPGASGAIRLSPSNK
jgi:hypothetical protein